MTNVITNSNNVITNNGSTNNNGSNNDMPKLSKAAAIVCHYIYRNTGVADDCTYASVIGYEALHILGALDRSLRRKVIKRKDGSSFNFSFLLDVAVGIHGEQKEEKTHEFVAHNVGMDENETDRWSETYQVSDRAEEIAMEIIAKAVEVVTSRDGLVETTNKRRQKDAEGKNVMENKKQVWETHTERKSAVIALWRMLDNYKRDHDYRSYRLNEDISYVKATPWEIEENRCAQLDAKIEVEKYLARMEQKRKEREERKKRNEKRRETLNIREIDWTPRKKRVRAK